MPRTTPKAFIAKSPAEEYEHESLNEFIEKPKPSERRKALLAKAEASDWAVREPDKASQTEEQGKMTKV